MKILKLQHKLTRYYKQGNLASYFLINAAKACLYELKSSENIGIEHVFQSRAFFFISVAISKQVASALLKTTRLQYLHILKSKAQDKILFIHCINVTFRKQKIIIALTLIWVSFLEFLLEVGGGGTTTLCLNLIRIMPETSNLAHKYTHDCSLKK